MSSDTCQSGAPRVRWIWVPQRREGTIATAAKWIGLIVSVLAAVFLAMLISEELLPRNAGGLQFLAFLLSVIVICGGWALLHMSLLWHFLMRHRRKRLDRLTHLSLLPQFAVRLPQRAIELLVMQPLVRMRKIRQVIRDAGPGVTVAVNFPIGPDCPAPRPNALPFEPVRLDEPDEDIIAILTMNMEEQGYQLVDRDPPRRIRDRVAAVRESSAWQTMNVWFGLVFSVGFTLYLLRDGNRTGLFVLCIWLIPAVLGVFWQTAKGRQWWLVPGGLIYRDHRSWRRRTKVGLVTAANSPLLLHYDDAYCMVVTAKRIRLFACTGTIGLCVLAAWMSTAARPSKEEILALFGPDAEWEGT